MRVGLFIPCYVDQLFPAVGIATVSVLEHLGVEVEFPADQTCCGQPMWNAGYRAQAGELARRQARVFASYEHVVSPSSSCVALVRTIYPSLAGATGGRRVADRTFELCEFLCDVLGLERVEGRFPERVGLHPSCHGLRALRLGPCSELNDQGRRDPARSLLASLEGIEIVRPTRADECCGFGGTFAIDEPEVSRLMARDRIDDFLSAGARVITATDMSCLAHMDGVARRERKAVRLVHVAEILAEAMLGAMR